MATMKNGVRLFLALVLLAGAASPADEAATAAQYKNTADRLIAAAMKDEAGLQRLEYLCYRIGNRLSGSAHSIAPSSGPPRR